MQFIMETVREQRCFVLLDELLRGTNSDDKIAGTIGIVEQMATLKAIGIIATHDLEVCETTDKFPNYVTNKCFEANIENEQLHFDYRLRAGICKNRSASFLLEQYRVIPRKNG
jgi:DNA mismatch repair ATPase MutS